MVISWGKYQLSMVVADGLAPIWCQDICNHHGDVGQLVQQRSLPKWWEGYSQASTSASSLYIFNSSQKTWVHIKWCVFLSNIIQMKFQDCSRTYLRLNIFRKCSQSTPQICPRNATYGASFVYSQANLYLTFVFAVSCVHCPTLDMLQWE